MTIYLLYKMSVTGCATAELCGAKKTHEAAVAWIAETEESDMYVSAWFTTIDVDD